MRMRWDKWLGGAIYAGIVGIGSGCLAFFTDGKLTAGEGYACLIVFAGCALGWMKDHRPPFLDPDVVLIDASRIMPGQEPVTVPVTIPAAPQPNLAPPTLPPNES